MLVRTTLATVLGATLLLAGITTTAEASAEEVTLGTLAPKNSPWGKVFSAWAKAVNKKTDGKLDLKFYWNGSQGDEKAMIDKMRAGQLDGGAVTSVGLAKIHKDFLGLQMPGLCTNWKCVDKVRNGVASDLQGKAEGAGFYLLGWGDVGLARTFSKGKAIKSPDDLKGMKVYGSESDPAAKVIGSVIGYTPVLKGVPALLPALSSGQVNVATVPALAATQLQWSSHFDHVTDDAAAGVIGGLVVRKKTIDGLPGDVKDTLKSTGKKAGEMLTDRIREEDAKAFKLVSGKMKVVTLSGDEKGKWKKVFAEIRTKLGQGEFSADYVKKLEGLAK
ncbi:MAG: TRAP transporter substrate-binding protein DctP [Polyangiaceae bacterium]